MALHALLYCERLFYVEEVEGIYVADDRVWAGRRLHDGLEESGELVEVVTESSALGLRGKFDAVRRRGGHLYPVEHKRGRACRSEEGVPEAWPSDRIQVLAYAMLLEELEGRAVTEARVRYHKDNVTVRVDVDGGARESVLSAVARAQELAGSGMRPPVVCGEERCVRCSLAPACLPEESRMVGALRRGFQPPRPQRLYPADLEKRSLHLVGHKSRLGRRGERFRIRNSEQGDTEIGTREISDIVVHGHAQVTTQALRECANLGIPVHWVTTGGGFVGTFVGGAVHARRRVRQYAGLSAVDTALDLARRVVMAKVELQLRHLLRATRGAESLRRAVKEYVESLRGCLRRAARATSQTVLMGHEGSAARAYFGGLPLLVAEEIPTEMRPHGRSRRPPRDRFNALLSLAYSLLYRDVVSAITRVGLDPSLGFLHTPHAASHPLAHDLVELFRVPVVDMAVLGAVNRRTFNPEHDFVVTKGRVWTSDSGRKKLIGLYERRKQEEHKHPVIGYSLSYARMMELEVRLLEKEWSGEPGLFAKLRLR